MIIYFNKGNYGIDTKTKQIIQRFNYDIDIMPSRLGFYLGIKKIKKINVEEKTKDNKYLKVITIINQDNDVTILTLNKDSYIIKYQNDRISEINNSDFEKWLGYKLQEFIAPSLKKIEDNFFPLNYSIENLVLSSVEAIGNNFLYCNQALRKLKLNKVTTIGNNFLHDNEVLKEFIAPKLKVVGNKFLHNKLCLNDILRLIESIEKYKYDGYEKDLLLLNSLKNDYIKVSKNNNCRNEFEVYMSDSTLIERLVKLELSIEASINNYLYMKDDLDTFNKINSSIEKARKLTR